MIQYTNSPIWGNVSPNENFFDINEIENYQLFNQHPDLFPHIYKLTKDYVIMDKLNSPGKPLMDVYNFLDDVYYHMLFFLGHLDGP